MLLHWYNGTRLDLMWCMCPFWNRSAIYLTMKALWPLLCSWQSGVCMKLLSWTIAAFSFTLFKMWSVFFFFSHSLPGAVEEAQSQTCFWVESVWLVRRGGIAFYLSSSTQANTKINIKKKLILFFIVSPPSNIIILTFKSVSLIFKVVFFCVIYLNIQLLSYRRSWFWQ